MIHVSQGTAAVLGLSVDAQLIRPRTGYLLLGENCINDCGFCPQSRSSTAGARLLSRVAWTPFDLERVVAECEIAAARGDLERVCAQVVMCQDDRWLYERLSRLLTQLPCPLSASLSVRSAGLARELLAAGVDRVSLPLDAATASLYSAVKGGDFETDMETVAKLASETGSVGTHLIIGLGETEREACEFLRWGAQYGINTALFAFTPVRGTRMAGRLPPALDTYRRIQIARHLLVTDHSGENWTYDSDGRIESFGLSANELNSILADGRAFETSGCPGCNRPFYNERPGGQWYNYARPLTADEAFNAMQTALCVPMAD